jgi:hypothetical protein
MVMRAERDEYREDRIVMRAVVDAYGSEERAIGWYYYLENELSFPFRARCLRRKATSPLKEDELYEVVGMADVGDCDHDMYVMTDFGEDQLAVPLSQLDPVGEVDDETREAILDWHYWVEQGYQF